MKRWKNSYTSLGTNEPHLYGENIPACSENVHVVANSPDLVIIENVGDHLEYRFYHDRILDEAFTIHKNFLVQVAIIRQEPPKKSKHPVPLYRAMIERTDGVDFNVFDLQYDQACKLYEFLCSHLKLKMSLFEKPKVEEKVKAEPKKVVTKAEPKKVAAKVEPKKSRRSRKKKQPAKKSPVKTLYPRLTNLGKAQKVPAQYPLPKKQFKNSEEVGMHQPQQHHEQRQHHYNERPPPQYAQVQHAQQPQYVSRQVQQHETAKPPPFKPIPAMQQPDPFAALESLPCVSSLPTPLREEQQVRQEPLIAL